MTSVDLLIEHLEAALAEARAFQAEQESERASDDWIPLPEAADRFGCVSKELIQSWCQRNEGFGQKRAGRWYVSVAKMRAKLELG
ncbi:hypothetical protein NKJ66_07315 [Mesorhizobium sp. M0078]|uniref:hypothetical protein n=1 Tax=Mesorhizobium sp. M0078 TaxID=2956871 RepID=UPI00333B35A6